MVMFFAASDSKNVRWMGQQNPAPENGGKHPIVYRLSTGFNMFQPSFWCRILQPSGCD
jgi:hypothetical protein